MAKRKREREVHNQSTTANGTTSKVIKTNGHIDVKTSGPVLQIIVGSYERILHGITASISSLSSTSSTIQFADSFLFNAHTSSIRCLALSPISEQESPENQALYLATGGSDERINVYSLSTSPMPENDKIPKIPTLGNNNISENPGNRELGTIMQHASNITVLHFPTRSKLLSASEDNTIAISRTKDLTVVSTIKVPRPKALGQPSGDTAPVGATPAGVNGIAVHPSMKLMISVGRGEKCMRLWNLVTGKKAGVLNFDRHMLSAVKESKHSSGEGRRISWNIAGTEFAVSFERGIIVFGEDSQPRCVALPQPLTKLHQIKYLSPVNGTALLAVSTEDGRIVFYNTSGLQASEKGLSLNAEAIAQLGGRASGISGRIKDFKVLSVKEENRQDSTLIVTASSDGSVRVWHVKPADLQPHTGKDDPRQVGGLIGVYETGNRITCLEAFVMTPVNDDLGGLSEFEGFTEADDDDTDSSDED